MEMSFIIASALLAHLGGRRSRFEPLLNLVSPKLVALISVIFRNELYVFLTEQYLLHLKLKWLGLLLIWTLAKVQRKADSTALSKKKKKPTGDILSL